MILNLLPDDFKPLVKVEINGTSYTALVDSGAHPSHLYMKKSDKDFYVNIGTLKKLNIQNGCIDHENNLIESSIYILSNLKIGDISLKNVYVNVLPENQVERIDMIIGNNILNNFNYSIDNKDRTISLERLEQPNGYFYDYINFYNTLTELIQSQEDYDMDIVLYIELPEMIAYKYFLDLNKDIKDQYEQLSIQYGFQDDPDPYLRVYRKLQKESFNNKK